MSDPSRAGEAEATDGSLRQPSVLVALRDVTAGYGSSSSRTISGPRAVVSGVNIEVTDHSFLGVVGPSGAGKTTILRMIAGSMLNLRHQGTLVRASALTVGYVPQLNTVDWNFPVTVTECVLLARTARRLLPWPTSTDRKEAAAVLDRLGIGDLAARHIRELSGGQQQRVFLARALLQAPQLLLLDEPTSGVDLPTRHDILHLLGELHRDGLAIVITTHDLNGVAAHLPQIVLVNRRVIAQGSPGEVMNPPNLERTYGAPMDVLQHAGLPVVVPGYRASAAHLDASTRGIHASSGPPSTDSTRAG